EAVARRVRAALKPGGRFVAEFGGKGNVAAVTAALRAAADQLGLRPELPAWYFPSVGAYAALLEAEGLEVRSAAPFDRPSPREGASGLRNWVAMFAPGLVGAVPGELRETFLGAAEAAARGALFRDGGWFADYRRLRVVAVRAD